VGRASGLPLRPQSSAAFFFSVTNIRRHRFHCQATLTHLNPNQEQAMFSILHKATTKKRVNFRPSLDHLENRLTPTTFVNLSQGGHTLNITGDNHANTVDIQQDDTNNQLTVVADGHTVQFDSDQITNIKVNLKGGDDQFSYGLQSDFTNSKKINIDLGKGNDQAQLNFFNDGNIKADLAINVLGGSGNDQLKASFGEVDDAKLTLNAFMGDGKDDVTVNLLGDLKGTTKVNINVDGGAGKDMFFFEADNDMVNNDTTGIDIDSDASLNVRLLGGLDRDVMDAFYEGELNGKFNFLADGGKGNDKIDAEFTLDSGSTGSLKAAVLGGKGDDDLKLNVTDNSNGQADVHAFVDGGSGFDTCDSTPNVHVFNCEA
jgi:hypothetical protein